MHLVTAEESKKTKNKNKQKKQKLNKQKTQLFMLNFSVLVHKGERVLLSKRRFAQYSLSLRTEAVFVVTR